MLFSPKYNAILGEEIAQKLSYQELIETYKKLAAINEKTAEELAELEDKNPEAYEQKMRLIENEEVKADDEYFNSVEEKMLIEGDEENQAIEAIEKDIDSLEEEAVREIDDDFEAAEDLLQNLLAEVNQHSPQ